MLAWALSHRRFATGLLGAVLFAFLVTGISVSRYRAGRAHVQALWDADTAKREAEVARVRAANEELEHRFARYSKEQADAYRQDLDAIRVDRDSLTRRLRDYEIRYRALSEVADRQEPAQPAPEPRGQSVVDEALERYDAACRADAAQLQRLINLVEAQLDRTEP